jgi:hypothetical protein
LADETVYSEDNDDDNDGPPPPVVVTTGLRVTGEDVGFLADLDDDVTELVDDDGLVVVGCLDVGGDETVSSEDDDEDGPPPPVVVTTGLRVRGEDVGFLADLDDKLETVSSEDDVTELVDDDGLVVVVCLDDGGAVLADGLLDGFAVGLPVGFLLPSGSKV